MFLQSASSLSRAHRGLQALSRFADGSKPMGTARSPEPVCGFSKPVPVVRIACSSKCAHVFRHALEVRSKNHLEGNLVGPFRE